MMRIRLLQVASSLTAVGAVAILTLASVGAAQPTNQTEGLPSSQKAAFEDGRVTAAEYEDAVERTMDCVSAGGVEIVDGPTETIDGQLRFTMQASPAEHGVYDACYAEHLMVTEEQYLSSVAPSEAEMAFRRRRVSGCIREIRPGFEESPSGEEIMQVIVADERVAKHCGALIVDVGQF